MEVVGGRGAGIDEGIEGEVKEETEENMKRWEGRECKSREREGEGEVEREV